jgi:hypothetical protein
MESNFGQHNRDPISIGVLLNISQGPVRVVGSIGFIRILFFVERAMI